MSRSPETAKTASESSADHENAGKPASSQSTKAHLRPLLQLLPYLGRYKRTVAGAVVALLAASGATLVLPAAVRRMVDHGFGTANLHVVNGTFLMLIVVAAVLALSSAFRYYLVMWIGERITADVRSDVFDHLMDLSPAFFDTTRSGEILSRLTADTTQIKSAFGSSASVALRNLVMFMGSISMMVFTSPRLSLVVLVAIPIIVLPLIGFGRAVRRRSRLAQDTLANASAYAAEMLGATRTLQAFTRERSTADDYRSAVIDAFQAARTALATRAFLIAFAIFIVFSSVVAVLWIGAGDVLSGRMTGGELSQFLLYSVMAASALGQLSEVWGEVSQAAGAAERLSELLHVPTDITPPAHPIALPSPAQGALAFDKVSFHYATDSSVPILHDITLDIAPGETVALVGPSGAGKSTLFHLIMRFYDPTSGLLRLDGHDLRDLDPRALRREIALVPQDTAIFADTVAENIAFGREGATPQEIQQAAEAAQAADFIADMSDGYQTRIGERGITLSGGQRQRIAIARAILKDAPILLLDEATSALDSASETAVQKALETLMQGRTTLVIAHRLATVLKADRIIVMDHGRIVESGTHDSLLGEGGLYARLARLQFQAGSDALLRSMGTEHSN